MKWFLAGKQCQENNETIVPIVVAWNAVDRDAFRKGRIRVGGSPSVWVSELFLICFAARERIDFIAAHDQALAAARNIVVHLDRLFGRKSRAGERCTDSGTKF